MNRIIYALLFLIALFLPAPSHAWLIYYKPAFHGRVINAETKEPIESAVVVVEYSKETVGIPEHYSSVIEVKETLTDKNGEFYIPSYTTVIQPLSVEGWATFIIYKPGYSSFPGYIMGEKYQISAPLKYKMSLDAIEEFFSRPFGETGEIKWDIGKATVTYGIVDLPELKTWEERNKANMISLSGDIPESKWQLLHEMTQKEEEWLRANKGWRK